MTTQDIIQYLEQSRLDATEHKEMEELSQSELDQICGAGGREPVGLEFRRRFNW